MTVAIIVLARMTSAELPAMFMETVMDKSFLEYQLERLQRVKNTDRLVIATTDREAEQPIVELCERMGVACFRGSEADGLACYYGAASQYGADVVVRVTSECPLIDPVVVERVIAYYLENQDKYDYISNTFPVLTYPRGMDTEIFSYHILKEMHQEAHDQLEREHVTLYIKRRQEWYRLRNLPYHMDVSRYRWTVDTPEDLELVSRMLTQLVPNKPQFTLEDCLQVMINHPDWVKLNAGVTQRLVK